MWDDTLRNNGALGRCKNEQEREELKGDYADQIRSERRDREPPELPKMVECRTCGWVGLDNQVIAQNSAMNPGCPGCGNDDFLDVED